MSEHPGQYGNVPPVPPLVSRVEAVERQISLIADIQEKNAGAIAALVNSVDHMRTNFDSRLADIERGITALNESNRLLVDLITSRLPAPPTAE
jgi:hypothetical protein